MGHKSKVVARVVLGLAVFINAIIAAMYVLDLLSGVDAKEMAVKTILVLSIIGVAATAMLAIGSSNTPPQS